MTLSHQIQIRKEEMKKIKNREIKQEQTQPQYIRKSIISNAKAFKPIKSIKRTPQALIGKEETIFEQQYPRYEIQTQINDRQDIVHSPLHKDKHIKELSNKNAV